MMGHEFTNTLFDNPLASAGPKTSRRSLRGHLLAGATPFAGGLAAGV